MQIGLSPASVCLANSSSLNHENLSPAKRRHICGDQSLFVHGLE
jgi:hypothetical protein